MPKKCFLEAIATLIGCVVGAGVLGIPYVIAKSGFLFGLIDIILLGAAVTVLNLFFGEVVLRTSGNHQVTGYAEKYFGKRGKTVMLVSSGLLIYGAMLAYIEGSGQALSAMFGLPWLTPFFSSLIFFILFSGLIYLGLKAIEESELFMTAGKVIIFLSICGFILFSGRFNPGNLMSINPSYALYPYGVILFAFMGLACIPELKEELSSNRKEMKKAIITGSLIVLGIYILFAFCVVGATGIFTTEVATIGLGAYLGEFVIVAGNLFALIAMATSFLALGLALKEIYQYDYKLSHDLAWILTCIVPFGLFLLGLTNFIEIIAVAGAVTGGIEGIMIVLMHRAAKKRGDRRPEYTVNGSAVIYIALVCLLMFGIIYQSMMALGLFTL
jgi:tyrosine-specific transport protein